MQYVLSNNSGAVNIENTTISAPEGAVAFDVYNYSGYTAPVVQVNGTSVINGEVEVDSDVTLKIYAGTFNGMLDVESADSITVFGGKFSQPVPTEWCYEAVGPNTEPNADGSFGVHTHEAGADATCTTAQTCTICGAELAPATGKHSYNEGVYTDPTYEADGFTTYTCTVCSHSYTETDEGSKLEQKHTVYKTNMRFGSDLSLLFAFKQSDIANRNAVRAKIVQSIDGGTETTYVEGVDFTTTTIGGVACYIVEYSGIAGKEMSDEVTIVIVDAEGNELSAPFTTSIRAYAMEILGTTTNQEYKIALVDMLNYGAAAQKYFSNYNSEDPANELLSEEQKVLASATGTYEDKRERDATYVKGSNLRFASKINLMFAINVSRDTYAVFTWKDHKGVSHRETIDGTDYVTNNGLFVVELEELVVADARQIVTCTIYDRNDNVITVVKDSVESNVARRTASTEELYVGFMKFADSAYAYLH
jgi:hypothetical protein